MFVQLVSLINLYKASPKSIHMQIFLNDCLLYPIFSLSFVFFHALVEFIPDDE